MQTLRVKCLRTGAKPPHYASASAAGADLYACLDAPMTIAPGQTVFLPTGIALEIPAGFAGLIYARSGLAVKHGLALSNGVGVIDSDYTGEIRVGLVNLSDTAYTIEPGERIAQLVIAPVLLPEIVETDELDQTARGAGGFGSTGRR